MSEDSVIKDTEDVPNIEDDVNEMIRLVFQFIRHAKSHGPGDDVRMLLGEAGLGGRHVSVLFALAMTGPISVGELAERLGLSPATVSQLMGELDRGGFVERREDPRDRRRIIVSLSDRHRGPIERYARQRLQPFRVALETLSPEERATFLRGWRILVEAQEKALGGMPCGLEPGA
jgi:DNA-binding MarR family transcriptional regulator